MMEYHVEHPSGAAGVLTPNDITQQLQAQGFNPQGISADGMLMTLHDDQGPYQVKVADTLKGLGWNVAAMKPQDADYDAVQMPWRAAVLKLPDDDMRRAYIEGQMRRAGVEQPQIVGQGRDWYVFNPNSSRWVAATNSPEWDSSDLVEAGLEIPRVAAATIGGSAGFAVGGGTPLSALGAAAGAGLAGGSVDAAERLALAAYDPVFREQLQQRGGWTSMAKDLGVHAGIDAVAGGFGAAAPMVARGLLGSGAGKAAANVIDNGLLSQGMRGAGRVTEAAGEATNLAGRALDYPIAKDIISYSTPVTGDIATAGWLAQAPGYIPRAMTKATGYLGENMPRWAEEGAGALHQLAGKSGTGAERRALVDAYRMARQHGLPAQEAFGIGRDAAGDLAANRAAFAAKAGEMVDEPARAMRGFAKDVFRQRRPSAPQSTAEEMGDLMRMHGGTMSPGRATQQQMQNPFEGYSTASEDVYGNLFEKGAETIHKTFNSEKRAFEEAYQLAKASGLDDGSATEIAHQAVGDLISKRASFAVRAGTTGEKIGRFVHGVEEVGRGLEKAGGVVGRGAVGAMKHGGTAVKQTGRAMRNAGSVLGPTEVPSYIRYGAEENYRDWQRGNPWHREAARGTMGSSTLASYP